MTDIQTAAEQMRARFTLAEREDGSRYWKHAPNDGEAHSLTYAAHGHGAELPNDWTYEFLISALDILADVGDEEDEQRDLVDGATDTQWSALGDWLASAPARHAYVNEAVDEFGWDKFRGVWGAIAIGQYTERLNVLDTVREWLAEYVEADDDE